MGKNEGFVTDITDKDELSEIQKIGNMLQKINILEELKM